MAQRYFGWKGRTLRVDLSSGKITREELPWELARQYIGCRGINSKILWDEVKAGTDPYGPENRLIFGVGPLDGTPIGMGRMSVTALAKTRCLGEGGIGGFWSPELKYAGYDTVVFQGVSDTPVYLHIQDDTVTLRDARHIWGKDSWQTEKMIQDELGDRDIQVRCIGPAGENLVHSAMVMGNLNRAGGRAGLGDIMGSKKLKAVAVRGSGGVQVADPERFATAYFKVRELLSLDKCMDSWNTAWAAMGGLVLMRIFNQLGNLHTRNATQMQFDEAIDQCCGEELLRKYAKRPRACFCCPYPSCGKYFEIHDGPHAGTVGENTSALELCFTSLLGITNLSTAMAGRTLCNKMGLDAFEVGYTLAWAMESFEKGILTTSDTEGRELRFGNEEALIELIPKIARREGAFASFLADGVANASKRIGRGSEQWALQIKGQQLECMPQRNFYFAALGVGTSEAGPDHTRWYPPYPPHPALISPDMVKELKLDFDLKDVFMARKKEGKGAFLKFMTDTRAVIESLPFCVFLLRDKLNLDFRYWLDLFNAGTGLEYSLDELIQCGERIMNLERAIIVREGFRREDDTLPYRMMNEPTDTGHPPLDKETWDFMLDEYYEKRCWDVKTAIPTRKKLAELGLEAVTKELETLGIEVS
jgi:aldehyde:ferredoxin oxidoreductase